MKKYLKYLLFLLLFSCDKIENPLPEEYGKLDWSLYPGDPSNYPYDLVNLSSNWGINNNTKGILLEDYTGHKCTNCPAAAQIAKDLEDDSSKNVIVATIHSSLDGFFQSTSLYSHQIMKLKLEMNMLEVVKCQVFWEILWGQSTGSAWWTF